MKKSESEFEEARGILWQYYSRLMREIAENVIANQELFDSDKKQADDLLEMHYHKLNHASTVLGHLASFTKCEKPPALEPLAAGEFRCFGCGKRISNDEEKCSQCGWTWKLGGA